MNTYNNYAFISYARTDAKIALELWKRLEKYPYPQHLTDEEHRPNDPKYVRRVFIDTADLSVSHQNFTAELRTNIANSKYLIVLCSDASAKSKYVAEEINCFISTHGGETKDIIPVIINHVPKDLPPYIDSILAERNCPIWNSEDSKNAKMDNRYCFYHVLEYMLGVDFNKLFSRYLHYTKRRRIIRMSIAFSVMAICLLLSILAWQKERALSTFEKKTFPHSLVTGYVDNFLQPLISIYEDSIVAPHVIIFMPYGYTESTHLKREHRYLQYIDAHYKIKQAGIVNIPISTRKRDMSVYKIELENVDFPIYTDNARTVIAIKHVVDFKKSQKTLFRNISEDKMVQEYTDEFIKQTLERLQDALPNNMCVNNVHFIRSMTELDSVMAGIVNPDISPSINKNKN